MAMSIITMSMIMARKKVANGAARSGHLSPGGRGRAEGAGEGAPRSTSILGPPHPNPLPPGEREQAAASGEAALSSAALYRLMAWLSPAFPVGAFSYSSGIEWAVETGDIADEAGLQAWLMVTLAQGGGFCDAVLFAQAHRAIGNNDDKALYEVAELAAAFAPSKERHLETTAQGNAFVEAARAAWPTPALDRLKEIWDGPVAYPVAVAVTAAGHGIALEPSLAAYLQALAANWVSAGVRLIPLGQTQGLRVLAALEAAVTATAARAFRASLDDIGSSAFRADLASAHHETQYTRLFRS